MAEYTKAPQQVLDLVKEIIDLYHEPLQEARIGVLMRDTAPSSGGMVTYGKAKKVSGENRALIPYDFIIWFAKPIWAELNLFQRHALADHELCHCIYDNGDCSIRKHDFEEFHDIIERYGFWKPAGHVTQRVVQQRLILPELAGGVDAIDPATLDRDVLDQIDDMLDG